MFYIEDKIKKSVKEIKNTEVYKNIVLINERPDDTFNKSDLSINQSTFAHMGFKESKFYNSNLSHNVFIDCYFNKTKFENISFIGCKFINCKFDKITLITCDFRFATFENCYIEYKDMYPCLPNLPTYQNVRWKLCTNLALESLKAGNSEDYKKYFYEEKISSEKHYWEMFRKKEDYYRKKYGAWDSIFGLLKFITSKLNKVIWGYGENIWQLVLVMFFIILIFTGLLVTTGDFYENGSIKSKSLSLGESIFVSVCNFFTITSGYTTNDTFSRVNTAVEGFLGMILMGFFVAALFRFINRR